MNKKSGQILILSVIALLAIGWYFATHRSTLRPYGNEQSATSTQVVRGVMEETESYAIDIKYPVFDESLAGAKSANEMIKQNLDLRIAQFKKDAEDTFKAPTSLPSEIKSTAQGSGSVEYETDRFVSYYFGAGWYMRGAAHGMHTIDTYIFDKQLGAIVDITNLFTPGSGYLQFLARYALNDLKQQSNGGDTGSFLYEDESMLKAGTEPTFDNFRLALPVKDGLMIYFTEYQVAPYAAGPQQVVIPYEALKPYINPEGVLSTHLK